MDEIFIVYNQTRLGGDLSQKFTAFLTLTEAEKYRTDHQKEDDFSIYRIELIRPPKNRGAPPKKVYLTIEYDFEEECYKCLLVSTSKMEAVKAVKPKEGNICGVIEIGVNTKDN